MYVNFSSLLALLIDEELNKFIHNNITLLVESGSLMEFYD